MSADVVMAALCEFFAGDGPQVGRLSVGGESAPYVFRGCRPAELPAMLAMKIDADAERLDGYSSVTVYRTERPPERPSLRLVPHDPSGG